MKCRQQKYGKKEKKVFFAVVEKLLIRIEAFERRAHT